MAGSAREVEEVFAALDAKIGRQARKAAVVEIHRWRINEHKSAEHCLDAVLSALAAAGLEIVRAHKWFKPKGIVYDCCSDCGIVRRADDRHRPCFGPVRVGLRHLEPLKDEYIEGAHPAPEGGEG